MLSGEFVASQLPNLLNQLHGGRLVRDLMGSVDEGFRPELEEFLMLMLEKKILYEEGNGRDPVGVGHHENAYWRLYGPGPAQAWDCLQASTVIVAGLGGTGLSIARTLAASGVGTLVLVDPHSVQHSDAVWGYDVDGLGQPRAEIVAAELSKQKRGTTKPVVASVEQLPDWEHMVSSATIVVLAGDSMSLAGYDRTNAACLRHGIRWVSARIDRSRGIIGPFVIPEQTACFTCFELRNRANSDQPADHEALHRYWRKVEDCAHDWPTIAPFSNIIGNFVALDVLRVLASNDLSAVHGRVLHLELHTFESRFHEILKLPRCPSCTRARKRPMEKIWDIRSQSSADGLLEKPSEKLQV